MDTKTVKNVVIIFSDKEKLNQVKKNFPISQFHVLLANSGEEAIELVKSKTPSLIVMDVALNGMDGIETCQIIRKNLNLYQPVIIFLAEQLENYTQNAAYEAGADDFLPYSMRSRLLKRV